jgi:hypothetical protein
MSGVIWPSHPSRTPGQLVAGPAAVPGHQHGVQGVLEPLLGPVELDVDGLRLPADGVGQVLAVQAAQVHLDQGTIRRLQPVGGGEQDLGPVGDEGDLLGGGVQVLELGDVLDRDRVGAGADAAQRLTRGDHIQPGPEPGRVVELGQALTGDEERVLHDVGALVAVAELTGAELHELRRIAVVERVERARVPRPGRVDQPRVRHVALRLIDHGVPDPAPQRFGGRGSCEIRILFRGPPEKLKGSGRSNALHRWERRRQSAGARRGPGALDARHANSDGNPEQPRAEAGQRGRAGDATVGSRERPRNDYPESVPEGE